MSLPGCIAAGWCVDRFGTGQCLAVGMLLLAGCNLMLFLALGQAQSWVIPLYAFTGFITVTLAIISSVLVRAFPAAVRFSGISVSYNLAYAVGGGLTPLLITLSLPFSAYAPAFYIIALCLLGDWTGKSVCQTKGN